MRKGVRTFIAVIAGCVAAGWYVPPALAQSGNVAWGPWQLRWEVNGDTALGVRDVKFKGKTVLYRGNMPVIRVKYDQDGCGPYQDRISWALLTTDNNCKNNQKICQRTFSFQGRDWLEISVRAFIGSYDIIQIWYFASDGEMQPRLFSRGLQCNINHVHHAYWQFDFDMDGSATDEAFLHLPSFPDSGFGPGWIRYGNEFDSRRNPSDSPTWFVRDARTLLGASIQPSSDDGAHDAFSSINAGIRRYHGNEVGSWTFGATGELGFNNTETVVSQDNVIWYVGHLHHNAADGPDHYHAVGPIIRVSVP